MKTIKSLIKKFTDTAKKKNIPLYYNNEYGVEENIFTWVPNAQVIEGESGGTITMLTKDTPEKEMLETALKLPLSQAIQRMTVELNGGYFSKNLKWLVIYLTDTNAESVPLKLICYCSDGELDLYIRKVSPDDEWGVDDDDVVGFLSNDSKTLKTPTLESSDTLTLEQMIGKVVMAGYTVTKTI